MNYVVESYENYKEENRLTTNRERKIEFVSTPRVLDQIMQDKSKILDCAAGTGNYSLWPVDKSFNVVLNMEPYYHCQICSKIVYT